MPFSRSKNKIPTPPQWIGGWPLRKRLPWLLLAAVLVVLVMMLAVLRPFPRFDSMLQALPLAAAAHPASDDIVLVAIDDKSIEALGRWPWSRTKHAQLLQRITPGQPKCIGLDLLLTETDSERAGDDALLAQRMREAGCVVLPIALQVSQTGSTYQSELLPIPMLAQAASALGHAHLTLDQDGISRSFDRYAGFPGRQWPHYSQALLDAAQAQGRKPAGQPDLRTRASSPPAESWRGEEREILRYAAAPSTFRTVSYIDVLRGNVPAQTFHNRYVLIGPTSESLGDVYATSAPLHSGLMPGVEIFANALQGLASGTQLKPATLTQDLIFNLSPLLIALVGLLWLRPMGMALLIVALLALRVGIQSAQPWTGIQFAPASGFLALLICYPMWGLMRLSAATQFMNEATTRLLTQLGGTQPMLPAHIAGDFLDRQMVITTATVQRVRDLHRFMRDGVDHLPDPTLLLSRAGKVFIANEAAGCHWETTSEELRGQNAYALLADIRSRHNHTPMVAANAFLVGHPAAIIGEGIDAKERTVLLRCVPFVDTDDTYAGWMVSLVNITQVRRTQSQRDEALRFISHDIREPSASILTVIELARAQPSMMPRDLMLQRIERHARTGLQLADGFVNLARAEAQPFRAELLDLVELLRETIDNAWTEARSRKVRIRLARAPEEALCIGDRNLLARAMGNVLSNALKYSPPGGEVLCSLAERGSDWTVTIRDQGPGIAPELQPQLFQPFHRLHRESHPEVHGVGLGLLLVRTALQRHDGTVEIDSAENEGCAMTLVLPKPAASTLEVLAHADD